VRNYGRVEPSAQAMSYISQQLVVTQFQ